MEEHPSQVLSLYKLQHTRRDAITVAVTAAAGPAHMSKLCPRKYTTKPKKTAILPVR
jgi:hypothetical protein